MSFKAEFTKKLLSNITNYYLDNYDTNRFGNRKQKLSDLFLFSISKIGLFHIQKKCLSDYNSKVDEYFDLFDELDWLYMSLEDEESRNLLTDIFVYRILGDRKIKLDYFLQKEKFFKNNSLLIEKKIAPIITELGIKLPCFNLHSINLPYKIFYSANGIYNAFVYKQYFNEKIDFLVREGDVVIDGGACYGDSALFFSHFAGEKGKVYSFDFIEDNIKIFIKNIDSNNIKNVKLIKRALWNATDEELVFSISGPGSSAFWCVDQNNTIKVKTLSIDDFIQQEKLDRVDFIKMDIEGSEMNALLGAEKTIKNFRPKLAISLYHLKNDIIDIPKYIYSLNVGYKFFLNHGSIHSEETVLLCIPIAQ